MNTLILVQLLLAHFLTDFVLQSDLAVDKKREKGLRSRYYWWHVALSGVLTYVILMRWNQLSIPLFIMVTHGLIDYWKISVERKLDVKNSQASDEHDKQSGIQYFFIDQTLHLLVIGLAWLFLTENFGNILPTLMMFLTDIDSLSIFLAFIIIIWPAGKVIGKITEPFRKEIKNDDSLKKAGMYIGITERVLVMIFVLIGQYAAIGFLIAGKSILRVGRDSDEDVRKKTEYVLIGTLLSFTVAIIIGLAVKYIMELPGN